MASVAVALADGAEPLEVVAPVDALRRGGVDVTLVSVGSKLDVEAAQGVTIKADALLADTDLSKADVLMVPGGSVGVENLGKCKPFTDELCSRMKDGRHVAAICAGPTILADLHLLEGRRAVCYPGCETGFPDGVYQAGVDVCVDGNLITATGPGTALAFGLAVLKELKGEDVAADVAQGMLVKEWR